MSNEWRKELRRILRVSWTAKNTSEWILNKAGTTSKVLDFVKARNLSLAVTSRGSKGIAYRKRLSTKQCPIRHVRVDDTAASVGDRTPVQKLFTS